MGKRALIVLLELGLLHLSAIGAHGQAEEIYKSQCSGCHGMDGSAATPAGKKMGAVDLRSHPVQSLSDEELYKTIAFGVAHKQYPHAFASRGLTQKQIADLVAYIRKMSKHK